MIGTQDLIIVAVIVVVLFGARNFLQYGNYVYKSS